MSSKVLSGSLAKRYALAILNLSLEEGGKSAQALADDLKTIAELFKAQAQLFSVLCNQTIPLGERKAVLSEVLKLSGMTPVGKNFLFLLLDKQRLNIFPTIMKQFAVLADERSGVLRTRLTVAVQLNDGAKKEITAALERLTGKQIVLEVEEDPEVLGGLIAQIGHTVVDGSLRTHMEKLKQEILTQGV